MTASIPEPVLVPSFDGSQIAVRRFGKGDLMPLLIVNAVGADLSVWSKALIDIAREREVVTWDHRGLHDSGPLQSDRIDAGAHAEDAIAALGHLGIERVVMVSWSNGSRIAFEIAFRYPERVAAAAVACGGYGHPFGRLLRRLEVASALPVAAGVAKHFSGSLAGPLRTLASRPELAGLLRQSGVLAGSADTVALAGLLRSVASCDLRTLLATYEAVMGDAAPEILTQIETPTLLIAGERDHITTRHMMEETRRLIPNARLEVYPKATHYLPIEFPARLSHDLREFFDHT
jgi:pimeloyl-ACP methyl ester carboxylesterase